jgi:hypothetical protein
MAWTSPRTWVAGETITAAILNTHLRDNLLDLGGTTAAWTTFTPTTTLITVGNGTLSCAYKQRGKDVKVRYHFVFGSTSSLGGVPTFSIPVTSFSQSTIRYALAGFAFDASASNVFLLTGAVNVTAGLVHIGSTGGLITSSIPFTWATGDIFALTGIYEAA